MVNVNEIPQVQSLSTEEREVFMEMMNTMIGNGNVNLNPLMELYEADYDEIPVTIDEFISNPEYMGGVYEGGKLLYPYWKDFLHRLFHDNPDKAFEVCLAGDTIIPLLNGTNPTIKELYESGEKEHYLYSYDISKDSYTVGKTCNVMYNGIKGVYKITLDNGESVKVTSNHKFLLRDKQWKSIDTGLSVGDSLMPFNTFDDALSESRLYNHKIVSIDYIGEDEVYDISVEGTHNFAIGAGCIVHNCITGAIGTGKSTVSAIALSYLIYRTLCLKNPQKFYGLTANSPIVFMVFNLTLELAYAGLYSMIVEAIRLSPWFNKYVDIRGKYEFTVEFPKGISLMAGSQTTHSIGKNVLGAVLDEVNFSNAPRGSKNSVMDLYKNIRRRLESRFLKAGRIPGLLIMVSSKNSELDFLEQYINSVKYQKTTWVVDKPVYEIKPPETYIGTKFKVAVGDKTKPSRIIQSTEDVEAIIQQGYKVIEVPTEYQVAFEQDINEALKDIAGVSALSTNKLIPYPGKVDSIFDYKRTNPFCVTEITLGLNSEDDIKDYLDDLRILKKDMHKPRFAHVDIGLKNDHLGLTVVHASKETTVDRYTPNGGIDKVLENEYDADLILDIKALAGSEIPLYKVREFIMWLSTEIGYKFEAISFDGFQSADSMQLLKVAGFNSVLQSLDRTDEPYLNLRSCIIEGRLHSYYHPLLSKELYELEHDRKAHKVDHPMTNPDGSAGSKDIADSLCGAVYQAQLYYSKIKATRTIQHVNVQNALQQMYKLKAMNEITKKNNTIQREQEDLSWL